MARDPSQSTLGTQHVAVLRRGSSVDKCLRGQTREGGAAEGKQVVGEEQAARVSQDAFPLLLLLFLPQEDPPVLSLL